MAITVRRHPRRAWRRTTPFPDPTITLGDRPELQVRNLLDDPQLRRSMGLDVVANPRPHPRFDRRRLREEAAA